MSDSITSIDGQKNPAETNEQKELIANGAVHTEYRLGNSQKISEKEFSDLDTLAAKTGESVCNRYAVFNGFVTHTLPNGETVLIKTSGEEIVSRHYLNMRGQISSADFPGALKELEESGEISDMEVLSYEPLLKDPLILSFVYRWRQGESPKIYPVKKGDTVHIKE